MLTPGLTVLSAKTDPDGLYGRPEIFTEWGLSAGEVPVLRTIRWPGRERSGSPLRSPDVQPCEHYRYEETTA
jgi:hypothetical protein